jgi:hypothetical protein
MQVGKISAYDLQKNFSGFYSQIVGGTVTVSGVNTTTASGYFMYCNRILHNQQQVVRCQLRDGSSSPSAYIKYWNMDGTEAAQFTVGSGGVAYKQIYDMAWMNDEEKYVYITCDPALVAGTSCNIYKCGPDGASPELIVSGFNPPEYSGWPGPTTSGYVGITASDTDIFVKVGPTMYKFKEGLSGAWASISSQVPSCNTSFHYSTGSNCKNLCYQPTISGSTCSGSILYTWYDSAIDVLYLRSISACDLTYLPTRWSMLSIPEYGLTQYPVCINQLDTDSLHYLKAYSYTTTSTGTRTTNTTTYFNVFNIDESLAAFLNVNSSDTVMPAGIGAQADIIAQVCNCWGTTLSGKLIQFWVSSGDGGVNPSWDYTDSLGKAYSVFTTGANVGISNVAVVVNEI